MEELAPGLYRWTARHPAWEPAGEPGSPDDWPPDVGSVAYDAPGALVLVDPLVADWDALDALVERTNKPVAVVTTMRFHGRSREEVAARYGATLVSHRDPHPDGVARIPIARADESMVWLEAVRTLIPGDRLLGGDGGLRPCPESWLRYLPDPPTEEELRAAMAPLLELPAERVLVSHGEPVLRGGREALRAALA